GERLDEIATIVAPLDVGIGRATGPRTEVIRLVGVQAHFSRRYIQKMRWIRSSIGNAATRLGGFDQGQRKAPLARLTQQLAGDRSTAEPAADNGNARQRSGVHHRFGSAKMPSNTPPSAKCVCCTFCQLPNTASSVNRSIGGKRARSTASTTSGATGR